MKFKCTIIGLLTAIFIACIFTSYTLIAEARAHTEIQVAQLKLAMETAEKEAGLWPEETGIQMIDTAYWEAKKTYDKYATFQK